MPDVRRGPYGQHEGMTIHELPLTIRRAAPDSSSILELAQLDSAPTPKGEMLLGTVGGEVVAAVSLDDYRAIADPFRPTADVVNVLTQRARQLRRAA
jgi:hypothetical protein